MTENGKKLPPPRPLARLARLYDWGLDAAWLIPEACLRPRVRMVRPIHRLEAHRLSRKKQERTRRPPKKRFTGSHHKTKTLNSTTTPAR